MTPEHEDSKVTDSRVQTIKPISKKNSDSDKAPPKIEKKPTTSTDNDLIYSASVPDDFSGMIHAHKVPPICVLGVDVSDIQNTQNTFTIPDEKP